MGGIMIIVEGWLKIGMTIEMMIGMTIEMMIEMAIVGR